MKDSIRETRKELNSIAEIQYGFTAKARAEAVGPKFFRITDIQDGEVDWSTVAFGIASNDERAKFRLSPGEIVFARTGATTGKSYLIKDTVDGVFASYLIRVKPTTAIVSPDFLAYYFQTTEYWDEISIGTEGAAQGGFNASKLGRLKIPLPPLEEQKRIVAVLDQAFTALDRARAHAEANLADVKTLFQTALDGLLIAYGREGNATSLGKSVSLRMVIEARTIRDARHLFPKTFHSSTPAISKMERSPGME